MYGRNSWVILQATSIQHVKCSFPSAVFDAGSVAPPAFSQKSLGHNICLPSSESSHNPSTFKQGEILLPSFTYLFLTIPTGKDVAAEMTTALCHSSVITPYRAQAWREKILELEAFVFSHEGKDDYKQPTWLSQDNLRGHFAVFSLVLLNTCHHKLKPLTTPNKTKFSCIS